MEKNISLIRSRLSMIESNLIQLISEFGISSTLIIVIILNNFSMQKKLFSILENNTKALQKVSDVVEKCRR